MINKHNSKAQRAYEAYPMNQNLPPWEDISEWKKECWQNVVDAVSFSPLKSIKRFFRKVLKLLVSNVK